MKDKQLLAYEHLFGLIGYPLSHSFSKKYFNDRFLSTGNTDCYYELFPLKSIEALTSLFDRYPNLKGLNVTIPYKESVIPFLDEVEKSALEIGAVNAIKIDDGKRTGFNTDVYGFERSIFQLLGQTQTNSIKKALVLGTGGASKAVQYVLKKNGIPFFLVSRNPVKGGFTYSELRKKSLADFQLIINTTPLGMAPNDNTFPDLDYDQLDHNHFLYDLVYNPEKTVFLTKGGERGSSTMNGLKMLYLQAEKNWEIWNLRNDKK